MRFCPYLYNFYSSFYNPEMPDGMPENPYEGEGAAGADISSEEQDYYDDMMRQAPPQEINRIMGLVNTQLGYLYTELLRQGINRNTARYLFRVMVTFAVNNSSKYSGTAEQKTTMAMNDFRRQYPWVFYIMRANGITQARAEQIVRTVIAFTLANLQTAPPPAGDIEQRATRITNLIRQQTDIFTRLQGMGIAADMANTFVRTIVLYVLRNSNPAQTPANFETRAGELMRMFEAANPTIIRNMLNAGVPLGQIRVLLRAIILFTLRTIYSRDDDE